MPLVPYSFTVTDDQGNVEGSCEVTVLREFDAAMPQLYSDRSGSPGAVLGNPFIADETGDVLFFVEPGEYRIDAEKDGFSKTKRFIAIGQGERYDLVFGSTGAFGPAEDLPAISVPIALTLPAGLTDSVVKCDTAPTGSVVITFKKQTGVAAWAAVFTATFAAGQTTATLTLAADATLVAGDRIRPVAPSSVDATFAGLAATIAAMR